MTWSVSSSSACESGPSSVSPSFGTGHIWGLRETGCECSVSLLPHTERRPHPIWRCGSSLTCRPSPGFGVTSILSRLWYHAKFRTMQMARNVGTTLLRAFRQRREFRKYRGMICITPLRSEHTELSHHQGLSYQYLKRHAAAINYKYRNESQLSIPRSHSSSTIKS